MEGLNSGNGVTVFAGACVFLLLLFFFPDFVAAQGCMSCISHTGESYTELACEGDSRYNVIRKCGEPDYSEATGEVTTGQFGTESQKKGSQGGFAASKEIIEKLYYNCGQGRFIKILTFRGSRLVSVENGDRGSGKQRCW